MKANRLAWTLLLPLLLNTAVAQQSASNAAKSMAAIKNSAPDEIRTLDGTTYKSVRVVKVLPDGIVINYTLNGGGMGMAKIKFENLSDNLRKRYTAFSPSDNHDLSETAIKDFNEIKVYAERGDAESQDFVGLCYYNGDGVVRDRVEAVKWYRKAAEQNYAMAQYNLGKCYGDGTGVAKDEVEEVKWYRKAADQNYASAQYNLGALYHNGNGVPQDEIEEYKWFSLAAVQGEGMAKKNLLFLEAIMTPDQISEAKRLISEFKSRKESSSKKTNPSENPTASGTGFFITDDGYLISNYHVVKDATKVRLVTSTGTIDAKVVQVDTANDLALLKADGKFSPLPIAASRSAHLGGTVATIGFPDPTLQGFSPKLAKGEIASLSGAGDDPRYFQISVPVQPGNSGGALVDEHGNVIGIVSAKLDASVAFAASGALPENVNYAVKSSFLLSFLESAPDVSAKLKEPIAVDRKFEDVVKSAQDAAVLVLVY